MPELEDTTLIFNVFASVGVLSTCLGQEAKAGTNSPVAIRLHAEGTVLKEQMKYVRSLAAHLNSSGCTEANKARLKTQGWEANFSSSIGKPAGKELRMAPVGDLLPAVHPQAAQQKLGWEPCLQCCKSDQ